MTKWWLKYRSQLPRPVKILRQSIRYRGPDHRLSRFKASSILITEEEQSPLTLDPRYNTSDRTITEYHTRIKILLSNDRNRIAIKLPATPKFRKLKVAWDTLEARLDVKPTRALICLLKVYNALLRPWRRLWKLSKTEADGVRFEAFKANLLDACIVELAKRLHILLVVFRNRFFEHHEILGDTKKLVTVVFPFLVTFKASFGSYASLRHI